MEKHVLDHDTRCSLEQLVCRLGFRIEMADNFINLFEVVEKIKEAGMLYNDETPDRDRLRAACMRIKRDSENGDRKHPG